MSNLFSERRRVARYTVRVPINVMKIGSGSTIDISASGIAFLIDRFLEPGLSIQFELALQENNVCLQCDGRVVRVESRGSMHFTAATIDDLAVKPATEH